MHEIHESHRMGEWESRFNEGYGSYMSRACLDCGWRQDDLPAFDRMPATVHTMMPLFEPCAPKPLPLEAQLDAARARIAELEADVQYREDAARTIDECLIGAMAETGAPSDAAPDEWMFALHEQATAALARAEAAEGREAQLREAVEALVNDSFPARNGDGDYLVPGRLVDNAAALIYTTPETTSPGAAGEESNHES